MSHQFRLSRNVRDKRRGWGGLCFSVEVVFVSEYRNISQMNLSVMVFRNYPVAKKFMDKTGRG